MDEEKIRAAIGEIRPMLQADGGDIELVKVEGNVVQVRLTGHCATCPFAQVTLQQGVESRLREVIPEIERVVAVP